jgi:hypothetical protein
VIELDVKHGEPNGENSKSAVGARTAAVDNEVVFEGSEIWQASRPRTLVVACSDGRLQKSIDEFLATRLGVTDYDRLYAPGGPAALGRDTVLHRTDQLIRELEFLMKAHRIEEIVLLFHSADSTGPEDAVCAHYKRILPGASRTAVAEEQLRHAAEAKQVIGAIAPHVTILVYRAEVSADGTVKFVDLLGT